MRAFRASLVVLSLLLLLKGIVWTVTLPPLDAPDEISHLTYAQLLGLRGQLPVSSRMLDAGPDARALEQKVMMAAPPPSGPTAAYYPDRLAAGQVGPGEDAINSVLPNPGQANPAGEYGPVTYALIGLGVRAAGPGVVNELAVARLVAVLLGVAAGLAVVWLGLELGLERRLALAAAVVVGLQPMWSQQTAVVTADAGVLLFATLFLAALLHWLRDRRTRWALLSTAFMLGALFSKPAGLAFLPMLLVLGIPVFERGLARRRVAAIAVAIGCIVVTTVPFVAWTLAHPGVSTQGNANQDVGVYVGHFAAGNFAYLRHALNAFWGNFGWLEQGLPKIGSNVLVVATMICIPLVFLSAAVAPGERRQASWVATGFFALGVLLPIGFDVLTWHNQGTTSLQGRYWLPVLPVLVILVLQLIQRILRGRYSWALAPALMSAAVALNLIALGTLWQRYYLG